MLRDFAERTLNGLSRLKYSLTLFTGFDATAPQDHSKFVLPSAKQKNKKTDEAIAGTVSSPIDYFQRKTNGVVGSACESSGFDSGNPQFAGKDFFLAWDLLRQV